MQHAAYTLQFRPLMLFIVSSESEINCTNCIKDMGTFLDFACPRPGYAPFVERVRQLHKDHALSLETAREQSLPNARPVDDFAHFDRNGQTEIPKRCTVIERNESTGKTTKKHAQHIIQFYHDARTLITLDLFSALWRGMFARISMDFQEHAVGEYLRNTYFKEIAPEKLQDEVSVEPTHGATTPYLWSGHWRGALGLRPGTGSGNQATEAFNRPFAEEVTAAGGPCGPARVLPFLQECCSRWSTALNWNSDAALSSQPHDVDLTLLSGSQLHKIGRSTAADFYDARACGNHIIVPHGDTTYVVMSNIIRNKETPGADVPKDKVLPAQQPLNEARARSLVSMLQQCDAVLVESMIRNGILFETDNRFYPATSLSHMRMFFVHQVVVVEGSRASAATDGVNRVCSCECFSIRGQCEHTLFVEGIDLPGRAAERDLNSMKMPGEKKRGRPKGSAAAARSKRSKQ